jgi:mono/diheme cytochrome c family protein
VQAPNIAGFLKANTASLMAALFLLSFCPAVLSQTNRNSSNKAENKSSSHGSTGAIERGKYIVEDVAICSQCHTPRNSNGSADRSHWLEGAAVWMKAADASENWPLQAPRLAGAPPGTDAEMVTLLTTGIWNDGKYLRPPMPQFRLSRQDAEAVVAYLKSLGSK